jgi:hypothetical protein
LRYWPEGSKENSKWPSMQLFPDLCAWAPDGGGDEVVNPSDCWKKIKLIKEEIYPNIKIKICPSPQILFYPKYFGSVNKNNLKRLKHKFVNCISRCPCPPEIMLAAFISGYLLHA